MYSIATEMASLFIVSMNSKREEIRELTGDHGFLLYRNVKHSLHMYASTNNVATRIVKLKQFEATGQYKRNNTKSVFMIKR